jgi:hypothetical protein
MTDGTLRQAGQVTELVGQLVGEWSEPSARLYRHRGTRQFPGAVGDQGSRALGDRVFSLPSASHNSEHVRRLVRPQMSADDAAPQVAKASWRQAIATRSLGQLHLLNACFSGYNRISEVGFENSPRHSR